MIQEPKTLQEKRALKFGVELLTKYGYGYTISIPVIEFRDELRKKGMKISHPTIMDYMGALERMGYVTKELHSRAWGVTYYLNRYAFNKLITNAQ